MSGHVLASLHIRRVSEKFCALKANDITEFCISAPGFSEADDHLHDHLQVEESRVTDMFKVQHQHHRMLAQPSNTLREREKEPQKLTPNQMATGVINTSAGL